MSNKLRVNALITLALAILFYLFFMTSKHNPSLSPVNAFAEDPYDAVGSFGVHAAVLLGMLSIIRAFRPYRANAPSDEQKLLLGRTQMLAVLAVAVTLTSDVVAMARYLSLWINSPDGHLLAALLGGLASLTLLAGVLVHRSLQGITLQVRPIVWKRAVMVSSAAIVILAIYPTKVTESTPGALLTVIVGALLLFAPMWALGIALVPYQTEGQLQGAMNRFRWLRQYKYQVMLVILLGVLLGLFLVLGESTEGGAAPHLTGLAFIALVYIGLETSAILIGYGFLRKPLGLFR